MGKLMRRSAGGDVLLAEWSASDQASIDEAERQYREWLARDHEAVRWDGTGFSPIEGDVFPVDAEQVVLTTGMGGG